MSADAQVANTPPAHPPTPAPVAVTLASGNLLNLAHAGRRFYDNQEAYGAEEYRRKIAWIGAQVRRLNAELMMVQEVWDESALREAVQASGLRYPTVVAPGAENGAHGTPRVGLLTRLPLEDLRSVAEFPAGHAVPVPELGAHTRYERPVLHAQVRLPTQQRMHVLGVHMKSKRPKFLQDAQGEPLEDRDDPRIQARAALRSLIMRGAEAAALRQLALDLLHHTRDPVVLMGDLNDSPHSVTSQLVAATSQVAYDRAARDTALFHAPDVQVGASLRRELGYTHIHQGWPDVLDQIWVSEEFVAGSRWPLGDVLRVDYFNDHLHEGRDRSRSDHGMVRAVLRLRPRSPDQPAPASA